MEDRIGIRVTCAVCGHDKKPIGRDAGLGWYGCNDDCMGYRQAPRPGSLWPGEKASEFGYPVGTDGTKGE